MLQDEYDDMCEKQEAFVCTVIDDQFGLDFKSMRVVAQELGLRIYRDIMESYKVRICYVARINSDGCVMQMLEDEYDSILSKEEAAVQNEINELKKYLNDKQK